MKRKVFFLVGVSIALVFVAGGCVVGGGTPGCELGGTIDTAVSLSPEHCDPYRVTENLEVASGGVLTIEPGTRLEFMQDVTMFVTGTGVLNAAGTPEEQIVLSGVQKIRGYWNGLVFNGATAFDNVMRYVTVEYAGGDERSSGTSLGSYRAAVEINDESRLTMTNCTVRQSAGFGVYILDDVFFGADNTPDGDFAGNVITENAGYPVTVFSGRTGFIDASNRLGGNDDGTDYVYVVGDYDMVESQTWQKLDVPYLLRGDVAVDSDQVLEIAPGTVVEFEQDAGLEAYGSHSAIKAIGTETDPITFTGKEKVKGYWAGLFFNDTNSAENVLEHVIVEYGGNEDGFLDSTYSGNITTSSSGNASSQYLEVRNAIIRHSGHWGIAIAAETTFVSSDITYEDNTDGDFYQEQP